jgi:arginine-tRNA-protein transferase
VDLVVTSKNRTSLDANDIVIIDETEPCPYLDGEVARLPLKMPFRPITLEDADRRLALGHRRTGEFVYQTNCPSCKACEPIRIDASEFRFSSNQRKTLKKGDRIFEQRIGELVADSVRVDLFNKHRQTRGLAKRDSDIDVDEYAWGFVRSCFSSFEISYYLDRRLVCAAICDRGKESLSAVYTFYDPDLKREGLGTYSILKQIQLCQERNLRYLYLGYYVARCANMKYKARFTPNERLIDGQWIRFE